MQAVLSVAEGHVQPLPLRQNPKLSLVELDSLEPPELELDVDRPPRDPELEPPEEDPLEVLPPSSDEQPGMKRRAPESANAASTSRRRRFMGVFLW